jgi:putative ATPase
MSLFAAAEAENRRQAQPLAARMRPRSLDEFVGQQHFLGEGKLLRRLIKANRLTALLFYGPPGTGKTTLAHLLATETRCRFRQLNAVTSGVKDLRELLDNARDVLLVGATTSNPFFAVNSALVSRSRVFEFEPISETDIRQLLQRALADADRGLGNYDVNLQRDAAEFLASTCDGDARQALSALEIGVLSTDERPIEFTLGLAAESVQRKAVQYDQNGDTHYDAISALIKSIRGSDPDAGIYWLARMLEGGEDVRFLTRRLVILASEDIGNADPQALPIAVATMQACEFVGLPECQLSLAQAVTYLACAPKSNAATVAIGEARQDICEGRTVPVPRHLRDGHYAGSKRLGHGDGYEYAHNAAGGVAAQDYLGVEREYYRPVERGFEAELVPRLQSIREKLRAAKMDGE